MDITVIIPSRGRVRQLSAALTSLNLLASRKHDITYAICCDDDDPYTYDFCQSLRGTFRIAARRGPRPESMGEMINDMALRVPGDIYSSFCDDFLCISPNWDDDIAKAVKKKPHGVFWWKNIFPEGITLAIITEKWRRAAGRIYTESYPFWYDDLHLLELWMMATDEEGIALDVYLADRPEKTQRMRDLVFWRNFFSATRGRRIKEAAAIARALGLPAPKNAHALAEKITIGLEEMSPKKLTKIEKTQGEGHLPPDPAYLRAKARAHAVLKAIADDTALIPTQRGHHA